MKQKKKRNSVVSHSATPNTSESSIPSVDKNAHLQVSTVDEPLTGHEIESLLLRENDLTKVSTLSQSVFIERNMLLYCS